MIFHISSGYGLKVPGMEGSTFTEEQPYPWECHYRFRNPYLRVMIFHISFGYGLKVPGMEGSTFTEEHPYPWECHYRFRNPYLHVMLFDRTFPYVAFLNENRNVGTDKVPGIPPSFSKSLFACSSI